jgi:prephenate dehydrogenase
VPLLGQDLPRSLSHRIAILGPGLIGGSLAMALRRGGNFSAVSLWARRPEAVREVEKLLPGCAASTDLAAAVANCSIVILCLPPDSIISVGLTLNNLLPADCIVTDAGSVKRTIVDQLESALGGRFVGSHPMAGSEKNGLSAASPALFDGAACILTPTPATDPAALDTVRALWREAGCRLVEMPPDAHDRAIARVSHLPHAAAASLILASLSADPSIAELAGGGLRDSTRIASGPAPMWTEILLENASEVATGIADLQTRLAELKLALESGNRPAIEAFLSGARNLRANLQSEP